MTKVRCVLREEFIDVTDISLTHKQSYVIYEDEKEKFVFELSSVHIDIGIDMSSFAGLMKSIGLPIEATSHNLTYVQKEES